MKTFRNFFRGKLFPCALIAALWIAGLVLLSLYLPRLLAPLAALERVVSLLTGISVVLSRDAPENKLSKLVLLLLLPWTGAVLCILWRKKYTALPPRPPESENGGLGLFERAAALSSRFTGYGVVNAGEVRYFPTGKEAFRALLEDILAAKSFIWLEYYIVARGNLFNRLFFALSQKAEEGLDVRLLYDGFGCSLTLSKKDIRQLNAAGIKTQTARPLTPALRTANRRNHRKIAVVDGEIAYTGGVNLADEYTGEKIRFGNWKDTAVRVTGKPAAVFTAILEKTIGAEAPPYTAAEGKIPCAAIADEAVAHPLRAGAAAISALVSGAEKNAYLFTPYLAPDNTLMRELKRAAAAGVDVRVVIPHIPDKRIPFLLTRRFARELDEAGVRVMEYTDGFLHAKSVTADGKYALVSSYNLDFRSLSLQAECGLLVNDDGFAEEVERDFLQAWETGTPVPRERFFEKLVRMIAELFVPFL